MKDFTGSKFTSKQFVKACQDVFSGITARNKQVQQLLILAVNEAAKLDKDGNPTNNLTWLATVMDLADSTKGINARQLGQYVAEVLTCKSTKWKAAKDGKPGVLSKKDKETTLEYNLEPEQAWYDYGKASKTKEGFDYGARLGKAVASCLDDEKGGMSQEEVLLAVLKAGIDLSAFAKVVETQGAVFQQASAEKAAA